VKTGEDGSNVPRLKCFRSEAEDGMVPHTLWKADEVGTTDTAKKAIKDLFDDIEVFDTPKPIPLLRRILQISTVRDTNDLVLDFFAGAAPIGEAVFEQNAEDSGNRRFIAVQIPEPLPNDSPARQLEFQTLSDVAIDRLRRAGRSLKAKAPMWGGDVGFRLFKLDASNIRTWEPDRHSLDQALLESVEHLKAGRSEQDVLYELLLKLGLDLCVPIETRALGGKDVHAVGGGVLVACLAERIERGEVEALARGIVDWHQTLAPAGDSTCVFRDSAFADDVAKTNLAAILEQHGIVKVRSL
jgi:adenine-specific DNA-methyltransferase